MNAIEQFSAFDCHSFMRFCENRNSTYLSTQIRIRPEFQTKENEMKKIKVLLVSMLLCIPLISLGADVKPTVVLVHGAFANSSAWDEIVPRLQKRGINAIAVQNPLSSLAADAANTNRVINNIAGPVVLVGHSWGGAVITEAGNNPHVLRLVYVAAFAPDSGQSAFELSGKYPPAPNSSTLVTDSQGWTTITREGFAKNFAQDLSYKKTSLMYATQGPINIAGFTNKISTAAWKTKPSWFVVAKHDRAIQPQQQRDSAVLMKATTVELSSSHVPMNSRPKAVTKVILDALDSIN